MLRNSPASVSRASSAMVPASSTPVGPPPMMTKVMSATALVGSVSRSALSKASRMRRRIVVGILQRLQARREGLPFVMAEIGVPRARRQHQRVVADRAAVLEQHALRLQYRRSTTVPSSVVTSFRLRSRCRTGQAISDVASEVVAT